MDLALRLALISCAAKTACEELLGVIRDLNPEEDPKAKKEAAKREKAERKAAEKAAATE